MASYSPAAKARAPVAQISDYSDGGGEDEDEEDQVSRRNAETFDGIESNLMPFPYSI